MQYMLLIYSEPPTQPPTEAAINAIQADYTAYTEEIRKRGAFVDGSALVPASSATTRSMPMAMPPCGGAP